MPRGTAHHDQAKASAATPADTSEVLRPKRSAPTASSRTPTRGTASMPRATAATTPAPKATSPARNTGSSSTGT